MQQAGYEFHFHAFAERQFTYWLTRQFLDAEEVRQLSKRPREGSQVQRIDFLVQLETIGSGQIPPKLVLLAHDERELPAKGVRAVPRNITEHLCFAGRRINKTGEHF